MGIYIKGLRNPKCCVDCSHVGWSQLRQAYVCEIYDKTVAKFASDCLTVKPDWCPIIEIPEPHGRLIDADAYCEDLLEEAHRVWGLLKPETIERINRTVDDLKNYQAVVEAEGSESHDD